MQVKERYEVTPSSFERTISITCDICGFRAEGSDWTGGRGGACSTTVGLRHSRFHTSQPEWTSYEVDICPNCFYTKLVPWLESQGARVRKTETD